MVSDIFVPFDEIDEGLSSEGATPAAEETATRFNTDLLSDDARHTFVASFKNKNTTKKTVYDMQLVDQFKQHCNEQRNIEDIPLKELDLFLARFFLSARKKDGGNYEPSFLACMQSSIMRYLRDKASPYTTCGRIQSSLSIGKVSKQRRKI